MEGPDLVTADDEVWAGGDRLAVWTSASTTARGPHPVGFALYDKILDASVPDPEALAILEPAEACQVALMLLDAIGDRDHPASHLAMARWWLHRALGGDDQAPV